MTMQHNQLLKQSYFTSMAVFLMDITETNMFEIFFYIYIVVNLCKKMT